MSSETALSPAPSILSHAEPVVHVLEGPPDVGKLAFALHLGLAYACGAAPWYQESRFPKATVAVISWKYSLEYLERVSATIAEESPPLRASDGYRTWRKRLLFSTKPERFHRGHRDLIRRKVIEPRAETDAPVRLIVLDDVLGAIPEPEPSQQGGYRRALDRAYVNVNEYFAKLGQFARTHRLNVLCLLHANPSARRGEVGAILSSAGIVLRARQTKAEEELTRVYGRERQVVAYLRRSSTDYDVWNVSLPIGSKDDAAIVEVLRNAKEPLSGREVARRLNGKEDPGGRERSRVNEQLRALCFGDMLEVYGSLRKPLYGLRE